MKIVTIVGARPQFIKAAPISRLLRKEHSEVLVHTGQHYDSNMSDVFFRDLNIPEPEYNLGIGSGYHGEQTGRMLIGVERIILDEKPDVVLIYGDTNSTLAGALAAVKLHVPVAHVEAGLRSFNMRMPEEVNRILSDRVSDLLFCPTETAVANLRKEGIVKGVRLVGDVMYDALIDASTRAAAESDILARLGLQPRRYILATVHRAENTDDPERLMGIVQAFAEIEHTIVLPLHPRTKGALSRSGWLDRLQSAVMLIDPVGYLDMVNLEAHSALILTDSGGIQKEAFFLRVPCVTLRDETEWVETVECGWNVLAGADKQTIVTSAREMLACPPKTAPLDCYGRGNASELIVAQLAERYGK